MSSGMLAWVEVPVYSVKTKYLEQRVVRQLAARELENIVRPTSTTRRSSCGRPATS